MKTYTLTHRTISRKGKNGEKKIWTSKTFYISYYEKRKRIWLDTGLEDEEEAKKFYEKKVAELECGTVYEFLKQHNWLDEINNPLYIDSNEGNINYHLHYAHSKKNVRYLQIILEEIKDPIGDCLFENLTRKDVQDFKDRLAELKTYTDGHGHERETTATFKNKTIAAFSTIWSYYLRTGKANVKSNPFLLVEKFKKTIPEKKKYIFSPEDYTYLFDREVLSSIEPISMYDPTHKGNPRPLTKEKWNELINSIWIDFFEFVFLTGLRGSEAAAICVNSFEPGFEDYVLNINRAFKSGLRKEDVNSNSKNVEIIGKPKTGESRKIVLCDRARVIARKYMEGKMGDDLLFTLPIKNEHDKFASYLLAQHRSNAFNLFMGEMNAQYHFTKKGDEVLTLHGARTSLNTVLIEHTNLREDLIAYVMGWTSHSLTNTQREHYTRYEVSDLIDVAREINRLYLGMEFRWFPANRKRQTISLADRRAEILRLASKVRWINKLRGALVDLRQKMNTGEYETDDNLIEEINSFLDEDTETMKKTYSDFYIPFLVRIREYLEDEDSYDDDILFYDLIREYEDNTWEWDRDKEIDFDWEEIIQSSKNRKRKKKNKSQFDVP